MIIVQKEFEHKYGQSWEVFAAEIESAAEEDFERWDDYIEWKAQVKMAQELTLKIEETKQTLVEPQGHANTAVTSTSNPASNRD